MPAVAQPKPAPKPDPEVVAYSIRRDGPNFKIVTMITKGDRILAMDESDSDSRMAQVSRIVLALRSIP